MGIVDTLFVLLEPIRTYIASSPVASAISILILYSALAGAVLYIMKNWLHALLTKTKSKFVDKFFSKVRNPIVVIIVLAGIEIALQRVLLGKTLLSNLVESFIIMLVIYIVIALSDQVLEIWGRNYTTKKGEEFSEEVLPLTKGTSRLIFTTIGFLFLLDNWGVEIVPLLASLGVAGVILGFALQDTMKNIFGGISLIVDKDFHLGDVIELEGGVVGEVIEITLRSTKIKTLENDVMIVPNAVLASTRFRNYAKPTQTLRLMVEVSVAYGSDPHKVQEVLSGVLSSNPKVLKYPKRSVRLDRLADYGLDYKIYFYISDYHERFEIKDEITTQIYDALYENKLSIPFPTRTIITGKPIQYKPPKKSS